VAWHKKMKNELKKVTEGPKKTHNVNWKTELDDKLIAVSKHAHWATIDSHGDVQALTSKLDTIIPHYKNNHLNCIPTSRCRTDPHYQSSCNQITDPIAEQLLHKALASSLIYKNPADFCYGKDTHYVDSFNNVLNIFQDKRIAFSDKEYLSQSHLAVLHWNQNVNRECTSEWRKPSAANSIGKVKKNYKKVTYQYRKNLWERFKMKLLN